MEIRLKEVNQMIKGIIQNIRSKVEKREIVQYLLLRERILHDSIMRSQNEEMKKGAKKRHAEIISLINYIKKDTLRPKIRKMHQHIHQQNDYMKEAKENKNA